MFEDIWKPNWLGLLTLGLASAVLPKLLPEMGPTVGTAVKLVLDLLTESEAEAAEELMEALVTGTVAELHKAISQPADPDARRQAVEKTISKFKHRARGRAHRWGKNDHDRRRRYRRHGAMLREAVDRSKAQQEGWVRDIFDDLGEGTEEDAR